MRNFDFLKVFVRYTAPTNVCIKSATDVDTGGVSAVGTVSGVTILSLKMAAVDTVETSGMQNFNDGPRSNTPEDFVAL